MTYTRKCIVLMGILALSISTAGCFGGGKSPLPLPSKTDKEIAHELFSNMPTWRAEINISINGPFQTEPIEDVVYSGTTLRFQEIKVRLDQKYQDMQNSNYTCWTNLKEVGYQLGEIDETIKDGLGLQIWTIKGSQNQGVHPWGVVFCVDKTNGFYKFSVPEMPILATVEGREADGKLIETYQQEHAVPGFKNFGDYLPDSWGDGTIMFGEPEAMLDDWGYADTVVPASILAVFTPGCDETKMGCPPESY